MTNIDSDFRRSGGLFPMRSRRIGCLQPPAWKSALVGLSDRIEAVGGTLDVTSPTGGGTTLLIEIPV